MSQSYGVTFQNGALISSLTVAQNIELPLREYRSMPQTALDELVDLYLGLVGLPGDTGAKFPAQLSGGMVKRAALARALCLEPKLLFLDEPTSGLDPISATAFDELLLYLHPELRLTVVMITHDLDSLFRTCSRVGVIVEGRMITDTLAGIMANTAALDTGVLSRTSGAGGRRGLAAKGLAMDRDTNYVAVGAFVLLVVDHGVVVRLSGTPTRGTNAPTSATRSTSRAASADSRTAVRCDIWASTWARWRASCSTRSSARRVLVIADIESSAPIDGRTLASLSLQGITGLLYVDLKQDPKPAPAALAPGHQYPVIRSEPSDFDVLLTSLPALASHATELMDRVALVLNDENLHAFNEIMDNSRRTSAELPAAVREVRALAADAGRAAREMQGAAADLRGIAQASRPDIEASIAQVRLVAGNMADTSARLDRFIAQSEPGLSEFTQRSLPRFEQLLRESGAAARDLRDLSRSLKDNPSQLIYEPRESGVQVPR